jgi:hypothetical protein
MIVISWGKSPISFLCFGYLWFCELNTTQTLNMAKISAGVMGLRFTLLEHNDARNPLQIWLNTN